MIFLILFRMSQGGILFDYYRGILFNDYLQLNDENVCFDFMFGICSAVKKKHSQVSLQVLDFESGAYENRTHDLLTASQTL